MKQLLMGVSLAALTAPAFAADPIVYVEEPMVVAQRSPFSGHIEAYLGGLNISEGGDDETYLVYGGTGRLNWAINDRWNLQGDVFYDNIDTDEIGGSISGLGGAVHAYWRNPDSFAVGVWGSYSGFEVGSTSQDVDQYRVGPEFQIYAGNWTIYGQGYYGQLDLGPAEADLWGARGVVRYFAHENLRFDGEIGYHTLGAGGQNIDTLTLALQANYRFAGTPLTVFGRYQYDMLSGNVASLDADLHKFVIGVRGSFGSNSLLDEDRYGATMDTPRNNIIVY